MESSQPVIRVLIIDDHPVVRYGVKHMLAAEADIEVVGELENLNLISTVITDLQPDVILLDLELKETQGVDGLRCLREEVPSARVIIYTSHDDEEHIIPAVELGVDGYLLKGCSMYKLVSAIHSVYDGGTALEASVASKLLQHLHTNSSTVNDTVIHLSKREQQVLGLLAVGKTNRDIGATLFISESTVKFHVHALMSKLGAQNRTEAVSIAANKKMIDIVTGEFAKVLPLSRHGQS